MTPTVLVPRGGAWGDHVAALVRERGATPVIVPLIGFAEPDDSEPLATAVESLARGEFDWLIVTSATTVEVLVQRGVVVPAATRVAAVGDATRAALTRAGVTTDFVPVTQSAGGLATELPSASGRALLPQSDLAHPALARDLVARGLEVVAPVAYRTVPIAASGNARAAVDVVLITSDSIAAQVAAQLAPLPTSTRVACIGPRTARAAQRAGLRVDVVAPEPSVEALLRAALSD